MRGLIRILLGPVLLWQGARVRRDILRLPEPDGARNGGTEGLRVLILGDSSGAGVGVQTQDQALSGRLAAALAPIPIRWRVLATTGWTTADALSALPELANEQFDAAILCLGVNDITTETGLAQWLRDYSDVLARLTENHGIKRAYLCGLPPMGRFPALPQPLRWYLGQQAIAHDTAMGRLAAERPGAVHLALDFSDMDESAAAEDGFHPGPPIYARWAEELDQVLKQMLRQPQGIAPAPSSMSQAARR